MLRLDSIFVIMFILWKRGWFILYVKDYVVKLVLLTQSWDTLDTICLLWTVVEMQSSFFLLKVFVTCTSKTTKKQKSVSVLLYIQVVTIYHTSCLASASYTKEISALLWTFTGKLSSKYEVHFFWLFLSAAMISTFDMLCCDIAHRLVASWATICTLEAMLPAHSLLL